MSNRSQANRPRMSRTRVLLIGLALLVAAVYGLELVSRALFAPWSLGFLGRDTLTGGWVGSLRARQGAVYGLFLDLEYKSRESSYRGTGNFRSSNLEGRAILCTPIAERYEYAVSGFATPSGIVENLRLEYADPKLSALNLRLSGGWRPPVLGLSADANPFLPDGRFVSTRVLSGDDPEDSIAPFELTRGELADLAACRGKP